MDLILILLLAAVLCVPITQRLGLGAIPGYLIAGVLIGPSCLKLITNVDTMINVSQWGVVMMLFIIGLELSPKRLWAMRNEVFLLGTLQMLVCGLLLGVVFGAALRHLAGMEWQAAVLCGLSLALSSTAVALRLLDERMLTRTPLGRSALGVLLFQDMAAIPMLVAAGLLGSDGTSAPSFKEALIAVAVVTLAYRLRLLGWAAKAQLKELFTAAALLMVVGAAQLFDYAGLSAGLGGFLVGVLMAESRNHLVNLEQRDVLSVVVAVSMGVVPVLIKLLERVPEDRGGMADLPAPASATTSAPTSATTAASTPATASATTPPAHPPATASDSADKPPSA
ncbi:cation:proton antiporter [Achromobacter piechaudii]|uniref:Transporter, CPA2 family n=1 Tax=Achromobacter piechaudii ATCC 43553 TaxID=742159 RepID=D4X8L6_9BURK|nr:cation:proton antiporter [Achromobacter piechaudii]EFF76884.1 transporter, CPA2 family [Achromobacter piechaudii ATCC 43553]